MNSMYRQQFSMMAGLILLSFLLLGSSFMTLSYRYSVQEKQESMESNAEYIANFTSAMLGQGRDVQDSLFQAYVANIARISDSLVLLAETSGEVVYASDGSRIYNYTNTYLPQTAVKQVLDTGIYSGLTTLGGMYGENRYVVGKPIVVEVNGEVGTAGMVFIATDATSFTQLWRALSNIFFFTAVVVLCIAFVVSSITSARQSKPLKEMAQAVHKFGHGEFDVRVTGYEKRKDEIGELADSFNNMADSLAKSEARRSEFVANVSHELKTPMTTIAGFADGILDGTIPPEKERDYLQVISTETRRLSRLVRRMLDLSRLQSAETVTAQEQFDVSEVLIRVLVSLEGKINARGLDVDTGLPDGPVMVWGDPDGITQVCYNLLDNAVKFAVDGSAIGISITSGGGKARVFIRNQGEDIPQEELTMLFDRFHKTDRSRSEDRDGVGLGLYIVKTILDNHREDITVTNRNGVTEFAFTLTLA